jgi:hypothetical protein
MRKIEKDAAGTPKAEPPAQGVTLSVSTHGRAIPRAHPVRGAQAHAATRPHPTCGSAPGPGAPLPKIARHSRGRDPGRDRRAGEAHACARHADHEDGLVDEQRERWAKPRFPASDTRNYAQSRTELPATHGDTPRAKLCAARLSDRRGIQGDAVVTGAQEKLSRSERDPYFILNAKDAEQHHSRLTYSGS